MQALLSTFRVVRPSLHRPLITKIIPPTTSLIRIITTNTSKMSTSQTPIPANLQGKKQVKILMLHGYTQSGPLFHTKTRAMEKLLIKTLAPFSLYPTLIFPSGPCGLSPSDIPGYQPPPGSEGQIDDEDTAPTMFAWFRKDEASGRYRYFEEGVKVVVEEIKKVGGVDAICGFSQGAGFTSILTAALETSREVPDVDSAAWAKSLREANNNQALKFAVMWSGFYGQPEDFKWLYEPKIQTPTMHYIGSLDTVVDESRTQALVDRCEGAKVMVHPGGHHVPVSKEWAMPFAGFIKDNAGEPKAGL